MLILKWIFDAQYGKRNRLPKIVKQCSLSLSLSQPQACVVQPCKVIQRFYALLWAFSNFPGEETKQSEALVWCSGDPVTNTAVNLASLQTDVLASRLFIEQTGDSFVERNFISLTSHFQNSYSGLIKVCERAWKVCLIRRRSHLRSSFLPAPFATGRAAAAPKLWGFLHTTDMELINLTPVSACWQWFNEPINVKQRSRAD